MTSLVSARGVSKNFGDVRAVDSVDFEIEKGRILGLIGPNGAGKTTLLKAVLGLTDCEGDLSVLGLDPFKQRKKLYFLITFFVHGRNILIHCTDIRISNPNTAKKYPFSAFKDLLGNE